MLSQVQDTVLQLYSGCRLWVNSPWKYSHWKTVTEDFILQILKNSVASFVMFSHYSYVYVYTNKGLTYSYNRHYMSRTPMYAEIGQAYLYFYYDFSCYNKNIHTDMLGFFALQMVSMFDFRLRYFYDYNFLINVEKSL